jgi:hypothetical protein
VITTILDGYIIASNNAWFKTIESEAEPPDSPMAELNALVDAQDLEDHIVESMVLILRACSLSANTIQDITAKAEEKIKNERLTDQIPTLPGTDTDESDPELSSFLNTPVIGSDADPDEGEFNLEPERGRSFEDYQD